MERGGGLSGLGVFGRVSGKIGGVEKGLTQRPRRKSSEFAEKRLVEAGGGFVEFDQDFGGVGGGDEEEIYAGAVCAGA
jgi:hypothetical protein